MEIEKRCEDPLNILFVNPPPLSIPPAFFLPEKNEPETGLRLFSDTQISIEKFSDGKISLEIFGGQVLRKSVFPPKIFLNSGVNGVLYLSRKENCIINSRI